MAVAVSFNPAVPKVYQTTTASVTGGSASTAYYLSIATPHGGTVNYNFKTDSSGHASIPVVSIVSGSHTWNVYPMAPASAANGSFNTGGN